MNITSTKQKLFQASLKKYFLSFLHKSFITINPTIPFLYNWHLKLISDYLEAIENKQITRLIINVPPRTLKSTCISVAWPAWLLGHNPSLKIIVASYAMQLAIKHSMDCKAIVSSDWYGSVFPKMQISKKLNNKKKFLTDQHGFRMATSVGGSITGEGANVLIVDDPHNPTYVHSKKIRDKAIYWYENTFATRLNDPSKDAIIIIMQRLHTDDLCSHIMQTNSNRWEKVVIPALSDKKIMYTLSNNTYLFQENVSIQESRLPKEYLTNLRKEIGENAFLAQYQQAPIKQNFGILKAEELTYYEEVPKEFQVIIQSWDTAFKTEHNNDFSVCTTWGRTEGELSYLIDIYIEKLNYIDLKQKVLDLYKKLKANIVLIEDYASGQSIAQEVKKHIPNLIPVRHKLNKFARFSAMVPIIHNKKILLPKNNIAVMEKLVPQLTSFPYSKHDDIVDSMTQYFMHITQNQCKKTLSIRDLD